MLDNRWAYQPQGEENWRSDITGNKGFVVPWHKRVEALLVVFDTISVCPNDIINTLTLKKVMIPVITRAKYEP